MPQQFVPTLSLPQIDPEKKVLLQRKLTKIEIGAIVFRYQNLQLAITVFALLVNAALMAIQGMALFAATDSNFNEGYSKGLTEADSDIAIHKIGQSIHLSTNHSNIIAGNLFQILLWNLFTLCLRVVGIAALPGHQLWRLPMIAATTALSITNSLDWSRGGYETIGHNTGYAAHWYEYCQSINFNTTGFASNNNCQTTFCYSAEYAQTVPCGYSYIGNAGELQDLSANPLAALSLPARLAIVAAVSLVLDLLIWTCGWSVVKSDQFVKAAQPNWSAADDANSLYVSV
jgi:hypothetical protein